ncbi:unnamed protein product, partial [Trichogramma brassicae]
SRNTISRYDMPTTATERGSLQEIETKFLSTCSIAGTHKVLRHDSPSFISASYVSYVSAYTSRFVDSLFLPRGVHCWALYNYSLREPRRSSI